uniref:Cytochrome c heme attachment protein n=1 Tax=Histiopteris incisa TaxID=32090 RepID=A0A3G5CV40_9MONI|nr:cytochrome c heme attachment protein [Histiopteris incisa]AYW16738.1 cytochrome c heme attachment protein [Histiopteris incisa]
MTYIYIERTFVNISFLMLFSATSPNLINLFYEFDKLTLFSKRTMTIAFLCTTGFLVIRWFQTKHLPLSNLYESPMFLPRSFSLLYVVSGFRNQNGLLGATTAPGATPTHAFATLGLPEEMQQSTLLVPASQSHWSMTHVSTTSLSYATSLCGSSMAIPSSSLSCGEINKYFVFNLNHNYKRRICLLNVDTNQKQIDAWSPLYLLSLNSRKCQLINRLDRWVYRAISLGFSFLTIGILSGAVWANEAWGSYRSWDPKETRALVTRSIHATYLHTRVTERWMGGGSAAAASTGFSLVRICFSGVNLLGIGLHNYGWLV